MKRIFAFCLLMVFLSAGFTSDKECFQAYYRGVKAYNAKQYDKAQEILLDDRFGTEYPYRLFIIAKIYRREGKFGHAKAKLEAFIKAPSSPKAAEAATIVLAYIHLQPRPRTWAGIQAARSYWLV